MRFPLVKPFEDCWLVKCPAYGSIEIPRDGRWTYNGDPCSPTFSPSINESRALPDGRRQRNHVIITNGRIHYCGDCTHAFAGRTVDIPPLSEAETAMYYPELWEGRAAG